MSDSETTEIVPTEEAIERARLPRIPGDPDGLDTIKDDPSPQTGDAQSETQIGKIEPTRPARGVKEDGVIIEGPEA